MAHQNGAAAGARLTTAQMDRVWEIARKRGKTFWEVMKDTSLLAVSDANSVISTSSHSTASKQGTTRGGFRQGDNPSPAPNHDDEELARAIALSMTRKNAAGVDSSAEDVRLDAGIALSLEGQP